MPFTHISFLFTRPYLRHPYNQRLFLICNCMSSSSLLVNLTFILSTIYAAFHLCLYAFDRGAIIPLTYCIPMYNWGSLKKLIDDNPSQLNQTQFRAALWCKGPDTSQQCNCLYNFHAGPNSTFVRNAADFLAGRGAKSATELAERQYEDLIAACLSQRTSWRKETCDYWCRVHLATPIGLTCLFTSLFFSRVVEYKMKSLQMAAQLVPLGLVLLTIGAHIGIDLAGGLVASLSALSALAEVSFNSCVCVEPAQVYWNHLRFVTASLAVWAAVTHQARDLYLVASYGVLGFALGVLAYMQYIMRYRQGCSARVRVVALYAWMGICVICACFLVLVQQHLYSASPAWSSITAILALSITCVQCVVNLPGLSVSDNLQVSVTLVVLSVCTLATAWDVLS